MAKPLLKTLALFFIFGLIYILIELVYRGYSHWAMFIVGGICGVTVGLLNEVLPWSMPIWMQAGLGSIIITIVEFVCGIVVNIWLKWGVWDYSDMPFNLLGQICLPFVFIWVILAGVAIVLDDYIRYWLFGEEKPHYVFRCSRNKK